MKILILVALLLPCIIYGDHYIVKVTIHYEALSQPSRNLINQVYKDFAVFANNLYIDFVPFGLASSAWIRGKWNFACENGLDECTANKYHACGISLPKSQAQRVNYVHCLMNANKPSSTDAVSQCAPKLGVSPDTILECANKDIGNQLLVKYGQRTKAVKPDITSVPAITFNSLYDKKLQDFALSNFSGAVCLATLGQGADHCKSITLDE